MKTQRLEAEGVCCDTLRDRDLQLVSRLADMRRSWLERHGAEIVSCRLIEGEAGEPACATIVSERPAAAAAVSERAA